jgi:hypothetical protein
VLPDTQLAVVVLTNAIPDGNEVTSALIEAVLAAWGLTPLRIDVPVRDAGGAFDPHPYLGRYRNLESIFDVAADDHGLTVTFRTIAEGLEENTDLTRLVPLGDGAFVEADVIPPRQARWFDDLDAAGRCQSYFAGRIAWRVSPGNE